MRKSRLSKVVQRRLIEHFVAGATARCAAEIVSVNRNTAVYYYQRLREIISQQLELESEKASLNTIEVLKTNGVLFDNVKSTEYQRSKASSVLLWFLAINFVHS